YRRQLYRLGMKSVEFRDETEQLARHYQRVLDETEAREHELDGTVSEEYLSRMKTGLRHWIEGGRNGYLAWGVFLFSRP
ncbi:MAG: SAM-dependent methyltransferase, partial [Actinobacteria bacterium]|nr:SAM-dependent methyltransferase [Actinomycetota bacterium]